MVKIFAVYLHSGSFLLNFLKICGPKCFRKIRNVRNSNPFEGVNTIHLGFPPGWGIHGFTEIIEVCPWKIHIEYYFWNCPWNLLKSTPLSLGNALKTSSNVLEFWFQIFLATMFLLRLLRHFCYTGILVSWVESS